MQGKRVMSRAKFVQVNKVCKRRKKTSFTGFSLLELIRVFPWAPVGFLVSPYVYQHFKEFPYLLPRNSQSVL